MAAEIQKQLGFESELVAGTKGVFDVFANGELVFSKHNEGNQFPEHEDLIARLSRIQVR